MKLTYSQFKAKVIEAVGEDYFTDEELQKKFSYYTTKLVDANGVAKNNLAEFFFDMLKEIKKEQNIYKINSDIIDYNNMQDRLHVLREADAIDEQEFKILAVSLSNRLQYFAQLKREALVEAIMSYDSSQDIDNLSIKMNYALEDILEIVKRA